jgi:hypothetical protein
MGIYAFWYRSRESVIMVPAERIAPGTRIERSMLVTRVIERAQLEAWMVEERETTLLVGRIAMRELEPGKAISREVAGEERSLPPPAMRGPPADRPSRAPTPPPDPIVPVPVIAVGVGDVRGKVRFTGQRVIAMLDRSSDSFCAKTAMPDEQVVADAHGALKNVLLHLDGAPPSEPRSDAPQRARL